MGVRRVFYSTGADPTGVAGAVDPTAHRTVRELLEEAEQQHCSRGDAEQSYYDDLSVPAAAPAAERSPEPAPAAVRARRG